mgnify:CR=1 FL=1
MSFLTSSKEPAPVDEPVGEVLTHVPGILQGVLHGFRPVIEAVEPDTLRSDGYSFQIELKYRAFLGGFRIAEFPIIFADRKVGKSKMNKKIVFEALRRVWGFRLKALRDRSRGVSLPV